MIHLLWRGLATFFKKHQVRYVFGLASVTSGDIQKIQDIVSYLSEHAHIADPALIRARRAVLSVRALAVATPASQDRRKRFLPCLLRAYLAAGATVCLQPVFDPDVGCYDFMTVLDTQTASGSLLAHFGF